MRRRALGRTGLEVSEIGFGAWAIGGNAHGNSYGPTKDADSIDAVRKAVDLGVNFFDTRRVRLGPQRGSPRPGPRGPPRPGVPRDEGWRRLLSWRRSNELRSRLRGLCLGSI